MNNIYDQANSVFRTTDQLIKLQEECGELITAIAKYQLEINRPDVRIEKIKQNEFNLIDELADLNITLKQINNKIGFKKSISDRIEIKKIKLLNAIKEYM